MPLTPINKATEVIVGEFYLVPCLLARYNIKGYDIGEFVPVIGDRHEDGDLLAFPHLHYHYDWRFTTFDPVEKWMQAAVVTFYAIDDGTRGDLLFPTDEDQIVWKRRKCRRQAPPMMPDLCRRLEPHFQSAKLCERRCPHKGIDLTGYPPDAAGNVVCPGHGLQWHLKSGSLVSRLE